ncbi:MAG TPA: MarR family winged helix-turn-helix transcriptional regulator [Chloroflexota bacterium]|nr:MarR family winged helix-turn-helix transcriptional regulator [Chloroflexota bacterium]
MHVSFERALAQHGVTVAQWGVLIAVARGDATSIGEFAAFVGIDQGAVTRLADRGRELTPRLAAIADRNDARFFGILDDGELRRFAASLVKLLGAAGIAADGPWRTTRRTMLRIGADDAIDPTHDVALDHEGGHDSA